MNYSEKSHHCRSIFRQGGFNEALLIGLRKEALKFLPPRVIAKVPPPHFSDEIRAAYKAKGISLEWNLTIDGDTGATGDYAFFFAARDAGLTPSQQSAAALLFSTLETLEEKALSERLTQNILDAYAGLDLDAVEKGVKFKPRRAQGSISTETAYIHKLATDNPKLSTKALLTIADRNIIGKMADGTFANHVSKARNPKS